MSHLSLPHPAQSTSTGTLHNPLSRAHRSTTSSNGSTGGGSKHRLRSTVGGSVCRQESRLGVTSDFVDLALHSAAANGNTGLVQYALSAGQPINSVICGVLPIHAGASSGSELVVRMLIEAGADVNSPRLPRRYSNERSKASGLSVGTAGSTPLHFAAANGHVGIIRLLLSFGADARLAEKHGITPEVIALQNGHLEAAEALRSFVPPPPPSSYGGGEDDDVASVLSTRSSFRNLSLTNGKKRVASHLHPQRSFDALATKLHQHAASSTSLHSIASLGSSTHGSPNPSTSQISLGAAITPVSSRDGSTHMARRLSLTSSDGKGSSTRRPSLPSVWEKAAHPRAALKNALGMTSSSSAAVSAAKNGNGRLGSAASSSRGSLSSTLWESGGTMGVREEEEEEEEREEAERQGEGAEFAERRRSMEVHRPMRQDSYTGVPSPRHPPPPAPAPPPQAPLATLPPAVIPALARAASQHQFYRPRVGSSLSTQSFGRRPSADEGAGENGVGATTNAPVFEDSPPPSRPPSPNRPRAFSNPNPPLSAARSPLLQHLQHISHHPPLPHPLLPSSTSVSRPRELSTATTSSAGFADGEFSSSGADDSGGSGASRQSLPPPGDVRRTWAPQQQPPAPTLVSGLDSAAAARARSNSASTDGAFTRFSSSPGSSAYSGPTFSNYAPSSSKASTAGTSNAPSSPGAGVVARTTAGRGLAPLWEGGGVGAGEDYGEKRAQARKRSQRAEQELLSFHPTRVGAASAASARSGASSGTSRSGGGGSLKEQLAAYGKSLRVEKELAEREREVVERGNGVGAFSYQTIQTSSKVPAAFIHPPTSISSSSLAVPAVPSPVSAWRAVPSTGRLVPTSQAPSPSKRGTSPSPAPAVAAPSTAPAKLPKKDRAPSPTSIRSGKSSTATLQHTLPPSSSVPSLPSSVPHGPPVLGSHGNVSFVGVQLPPPSSSSVPHSHPLSHSHHPSHHAHALSHHTKHRALSSDRSLSDKGGATGSSVTSGGKQKAATTRAQVEEDRKRKEEIEGRLPRAVRTVGGEEQPVGKKGGKGIRGLFGRK